MAKKKGLYGTPAQHKAKAQQFLYDFEHHAEDAAKAALGRRCQTAHDTLNEARKYYYMSQAESLWVKGPRPKSAISLDRTERTVARNCGCPTDASLKGGKKRKR